MNESAQLRAEIETLRVRLAGLTEAILRINEDLDLDTVLQEIVDAARTLTNARYSAITTLDASGTLQDVVISGMSNDEKKELMEVPQGWALLEFLTSFEEPFRTGDLNSYTRSVGFPDGYLPVNSFLGTRILERNRHIGNIYIGDKESDLEFSREDEETLQMFANQAAMAIANARRYGEQRRDKADLEALLDTSPVGVMVFDANSREVLRFNLEAVRLLGGPANPPAELGELWANSDFRRIDGRTINGYELPLERAIRTGESVKAEEIVIRLPQASPFTALINATPIFSEEGAIVSVVTTIQDMSSLEELEKLRSEFLGMVSHELRAPLTAIKGSAATVLGSTSPLDPSETRHFFRIVDEHADHMRDLISNLLDLTRIETGTLSVVPESTSIPAIIEQTRSSFLSEGFRNSVEVVLESNLPRVQADGQRISQVLYNLLANAAKFSREWSTIRIAAYLEDHSLAVAVIDEGRGIPPEHMPQLFSKFSRIESDQQVGGYGLGLAICKGIVEAHGGLIWAESGEHGEGTRFIFTIPTMEETDVLGREEQVQPATDTHQQEVPPSHILVIDDDPQILRYVRQTLLEAGFMVDVTGDPELVPDLIRARRHDLILLNLVMPGRDGFMLTETISNFTDAPIVFMSGRGRGQDIAKAFEMGAADYVVKPFSPFELVARIQATLRRQAALLKAGMPEPYVNGRLAIDYVDRIVTIEGQQAPLTPTEHKMLIELAFNAGKVMTHDYRMERVWGKEHTASQFLLRSFIKNIRQKLGDNARQPQFIVTEPGVGYMLAKPLT